MAHDEQDRLTALAGIYQAAACVIRIARTGSADAGAMEPCIHSLFQVDAASVEAVYGPPGAVANGARQIIALLTGKPERDMELTRYVVTLMRLERTLSVRPDALARIAEAIREAADLRAQRSLLDPDLLAHFGNLYSETISPLTPRILVRGDASHLQNPDNQNRIRALLLAGVRSAMLWRQVGGTRWKILLGNKRLLQEARRYLDRAAGERPADLSR